ncbi:MAG: alpha/beta fold hydrolase [Saprospiraceae bacterium]|nr:alpha/beta fold hydrolase [Saprospiraceae bacterium]
MKPNTKYTKSGSVNIAYQVFGDGPIDIVYIPGWVSNIDLMWECEELVDFLLQLSKIARVILFDKRGTGLSDRVMELSTIEERMDDIRAVMDAVGSMQAVLFGHSEGGSASAMFAATYPDRVLALIAFGIFAKRRYSPDYPWAPTVEERQQLYDMIEESWGGGAMNLESLAPSKANDKRFMDWLANYFRSGASPSAALVLTQMNTEVDIVDILGSITVPTLILQRTNDIDVKIEEGRFIADKIPGAKFVEFPGEDHLFWAGNTNEVLREMKAFIMDAKPVENEKRLFSIVGARFQNNHLVEQFTSVFQDLISQYRGQLIHRSDFGFIASFEGPSRAVHCCLDLQKIAELAPLQMYFGINIEEVNTQGTELLSLDSSPIINILDHAQPGQIVVTQTVKFLLSGAGLEFSKYKWVLENNSGEPRKLFLVSNELEATEETEVSNLDQIKQLQKGDSFLEKVLQIIRDNLSNESFNIEMLSRAIGLSERQLQRKLKAITNKSPNQLISSVRLHRAKELLIENTYNISEVAYLTGFTNPSYFSQSFKKEFGRSPSMFIQ